MYKEYENEMDNLIADYKPGIIIQGIKLLKNKGVVKRGTVLGLITASDLCVIVDSTNVDGSQVPHCILTDDVDTTDVDVVTTGFFSGSFQENNVIFGGTDTAAIHKAALRDKNIYLK